MATRKRSVTLASRGYFKTDLGWKKTDAGKYVQHRFLLGTDEEQAERSAALLRKLGTKIEADYRPSVDDPRPTWVPGTLAIAVQIAKGAATITVPRQPLSFNGTSHRPLPPAECAAYFNKLAARFPFLVFVPEEPDEITEGIEMNAERVRHLIAPHEAEIERIEQATRQTGLLGSRKVRRTAETLHQALDAYAKWIEQNKTEPDGSGGQQVTANGNVLIGRLRRYKEVHPDLPLDDLDLEECQSILDHRRRRPIGKRTRKPLQARSAKNEVKNWKAFFRWLHKSKFTWRKPEDFDDLETKVIERADDLERRITAEQVRTYSTEELRILYEYATPIERAVILLGLNCGFWPAEQGTLCPSHIFLRRAHGAASKIGSDESAADSFIKKVRVKNHVYDEWLLWEHTVKAVEFLIERRRNLGGMTDNSVLLVTSGKRPYYHRTIGKNHSQKFASMWKAHTARVREDFADFPDHSIGKLRKTAANMVRRIAGGEVQAIFTCHGQPVASDSLADLYANRPFGRVFETLQAIEKELAPLWEAVPEPFSRYTQQYTSLGRVKRMQAMRDEGVSVPKIAKELGVSMMTVYRRTIPRCGASESTEEETCHRKS